MARWETQLRKARATRVRADELQATATQQLLGAFEAARAAGVGVEAFCEAAGISRQALHGLRTRNTSTSGRNG